MHKKRKGRCRLCKTAKRIAHIKATVFHTADIGQYPPAQRKARLARFRVRRLRLNWGKLPDEDPSSFCLLFSFESRVIAGVLDLGNARADVRKGNSEALVLFDNCCTVKPFNSSMWHTMTLCRTLVLRESPYQNSGGLKSTNHEAPESATTPLSTEHCCTT